MSEILHVYSLDLYEIISYIVRKYKLWETPLQYKKKDGLRSVYIPLVSD